MNPSFTSRLDALDAVLRQWPELRALGLQNTIPVNPLPYPPFQRCGVQVDIARTDQIHPVISGNKWFKLKYNLAQAALEGARELVSFGGVWSNHLHALAYVASKLGFASLGVVRGDEHDARSNPMLREASAFGMRFEFVDRQRFRALRADATAYHGAHRYVIPEGGDNDLGLLGAASMVSQWDADVHQYSHVVVAMGTGCTYGGLRLALPESVQLVGVSALKGAWVQRAMTQRLEEWALPNTGWVSSDHHRGGFGTADESLLSFITDFSDNTGVMLEPLYTGKAMMALLAYLQQHTIPRGSRILFVHSGGLQGRRGYDPLANPISDTADE